MNCVYPGNIAAGGAGGDDVLTISREPGLSTTKNIYRRSQYNKTATTTLLPRRVFRPQTLPA